MSIAPDRGLHLPKQMGEYAAHALASLCGPCSFTEKLASVVADRHLDIDDGTAVYLPEAAAVNLLQ